MQQIDTVKRYYESTKFDYHAFWTGKKDLAIHFGYYDSDATTHHKALLKMNEVLASYACITAKDRVLDAGCGYGGSSFWLAKNIGCTAVGVGIVPFHIARARREAKSRSLEHKTSFIESDYAHTQFPNESFDVS
ncbi:MAG: methyltransferase domain-containing protein [Parcubacteria group bacterium]|nr:methyltransferase domain-containing protein [Parcubacteria group bacterium]